MKPITSQEQLLDSIATGDSVELEPITREEMYLSAIAGSTESKPEKPITRKEMFYEKILKSGGVGGDSGEIGKPYMDTSKITDFRYFCSYDKLNNLLTELDTSNGTDFGYIFYACESLKIIPQLDTSKGTNFYQMFYNCKNLESIPPLDTSKGTSLNYMFSGCESLKTIPQLDTSNNTKFDSMFYNCKNLESIPPLDTSKGTSFSSTFSGCILETISLTTAKSNLSSNTFHNCTALTNLTIGEGWAVSIYLTYSNNLSVESLHGMIENLADLTGGTAKTFSVGATNLAKIDEEHIAMLQAKNWNYS